MPPMMNMDLINPKYFDEVFLRVQKSAREKHEGYLKRIKHSEEMIEMIKGKIAKGAKYFSQDDITYYEKKLKSDKYWLERHIDENYVFIV